MLLPDRKTIDLIRTSHARRRAALARSNALFPTPPNAPPPQARGWSADDINDVRQAEIADRTRAVQIGGVR